MLAGRSDELSAILADLKGDRAMAVLLGSPGIGKTALLRELARQHPDDVLDATGTPTGHRIPFRDLMHMFRDLTPAREHLDAAFGELRALGTSAQESRNLVVAELGHRLAGLLSPDALLVLDDAHWFGSETQLTLAALVASSSVRCLVAARPPEVPGSAQEVLLTARPLVVAHRIGPLGRGGVAAMLTERGADLDVDRVLAETGGVPLLVQLLADSGATTRRTQEVVGSATRRMLVDLDSATRDFLLALAVCGPERTAGLLGAVSGCAADELQTFQRRLSRVGLLADHPRADIRHPALREAVLKQASPTDRARLHERAARFLHTSGAATAAVAEHLADADTLGESWAAQVWLEVGRLYLATGLLDRAVDAVGRGLAEPHHDAQPGLLLLRLEVEVIRGELTAAEDTLAQLAEVHPPTAAAGQALLTGAALRDVDLDLAARLGVSATGSSDHPDEADQPDDAGQAMALFAALGSAWQRTAHPALVARLRAADQLLDLPGIGSALAGLGSWIAFCEGDVELTNALIDRVRAAGSATDARRRPPFDTATMALVAQSVGVTSMPAWMLDRRMDAEWAVAETRAFADILGAELGLGRAASVFAGMFAARDGRLGEAEQLLAGLDPQEPTFSVMAPLEAALAVRIALLTDDEPQLRESLTRLRSTISEQDPPGGGLLHGVATVIEAELALGGTHLDPVLDRMIELAHAVGRHGGRLAPLEILELQLARARGLVRADAVAEGARTAADRAPADVERAEALTVVAATDPDADRGAAAAREALGLLDSAQHPGPILQAELELARAMHRQRQQSHSRTLAASVAHRAHDLGLRRLAREAEDVVRRSGGRVRRHDARFGLTPAEERVMQALCEGRSNPQIADALVLSRRTVDAHLRAIFRKLGVADRRAATARWTGADMSV